MSTQNESEHPERPEHPEHPEGAVSADGTDAVGADGADAASVEGARTAPALDRGGRDESDTPLEHQLATPEEAARDAGEQAKATAGPPETSIYVRRGRTPTLGFWVALAIALPAVAALISAPFFDFADLGGVLNFVLLAAVVVGLPLATIAAVIDSVRHRRKSSPQR